MRLNELNNREIVGVFRKESPFHRKIYVYKIGPDQYETEDTATGETQRLDIPFPQIKQMMSRASYTESANSTQKVIDTVDEVTVDVPLLIRLLEYAREDAKTDLDLHAVTERLIALSKMKKCLSMSDYNKVIAK